MKPATAFVLSVLLDGRPHSALEFKRGEHRDSERNRVFVDSVAQRVSELRKAGCVIPKAYDGHKVAVYTLTFAPQDLRGESVPVSGEGRPLAQPTPANASRNRPPARGALMQSALF